MVNFRALFAAFAFLVAASLPSVAAALDICAASMDLDLHFCLDGSCDPKDLPDPGGLVTLTIELENTSENQSQMGQNASGVLRSSAWIDVRYSCLESPCVTPVKGVFEFVSATPLDGLTTSDLIYVDNGDQFRGRIEVLEDIPFDALPSAGAKRPIMEITLRVLQVAPTPARVVPASFIYARTDSGTSDFEIKDPACFAGFRGGGQGSTGALWQGGGFTICQHRNPQDLRVDKGGPLDKFNSRIGFVFPGYDPLTCSGDLVYGLSNSQGQLARWSVPHSSFQMGGNPQPGRRSWWYAGNGSPSQPGIQRVTISEVQKYPDTLCFTFYGFEDVPTITDPNITIALDTCGMNFSLTRQWVQKPWGWRLVQKDLPLP